jgi:hypothetical protein
MRVSELVDERGEIKHGWFSLFGAPGFPVVSFSKVR